jgi:segregation and condensation protein A
VKTPPATAWRPPQRGGQSANPVDAQKLSANPVPHFDGERAEARTARQVLSCEQESVGGVAPRPQQLPLETTFIARFAGFEGTLPELAAALRSESVLPSAVPLLELTRAVLLRYQIAKATLPPDDAIELSSEALPHLSGVIELKARLLLPKPPKQEEDDSEFDSTLEDVLEGVQALAKLEGAIGFLREQRAVRSQLLLPNVPEIRLPRKAKPITTGIGALLEAARRRVRDIEFLDLALERLTMPMAIARLREFGRSLKKFFFGQVPAEDWGQRTVLFSALLEGVRDGQFEVQQEVVYGEIQVCCVEKT